jgi:hypothetical protein
MERAHGGVIGYIFFLLYMVFFFLKRIKIQVLKIYFHAFIPFLLKFWFTGFEFITVFLISSSIPYIYYHFENTISFYWNFIWRHFIILMIPLLINISFLLYQFYLLTGSVQTGIYHLKDAFSRRSSSEYFYEPNQNYLILLKKFHLDIITRYLGNSFINEDLTLIKIPFAAILFIGIVCSVYLYLKRIDRKLVFTTWFSILAPFSWFILFQQHAHIHKHIDFFILLPISYFSNTFNIFDPKFLFENIKMKNIIITGGAGFIGSHVVREFVKNNPETTIINLDALTYAGNLENLKDIENEPNYVFEKADITKPEELRKVFEKYNPDAVVHLAAESHVDRSITDPMAFINTNVNGTANLLNLCKEFWTLNPDHTHGRFPDERKNFSIMFQQMKYMEV